MRRNIKALAGIIAILLGFLLGRVVVAQDMFGRSGMIIGSGGSSSPAGPLTVSITGSPTSGPTTLTTGFIASPIGGTGPISYSWVFGDGGTATTQNPSHAYTVASTYTATLTVSDSAGHTATATKTVLVTGATYYVSKAGSDSNNGLTAATSFLTLTKCQTAMRSGNKVCIVNDSGTYTLGANLAFTSADNGEVWAAGFGQTPIIDGNANANDLTFTSVTNIAFYGFTFQNMGDQSLGGPAGNTGTWMNGGSGYTFRWNTYLNAVNNNIFAQNISGSTFDSNTFSGGTPTNRAISNSHNQAGMYIYASQGSINLTHNLCQNLGADCTEVSTYTTGQSNIIIEYNLSLNVMQNCIDCGAHYMYDSSVAGGTSNATGNLIEYNAIYSNSNPALFGRTIYLDLGMSQVTVKYNIVASYKAGTGGGDTNIGVNTVAPLPGEACFSMGSPSKNNVIENNICEVGGVAPYGDWYDCRTPTSFPFTGCTNLYESGTYFGYYFSAGTGNVIDHNIVFTRNSWPGGMWQQIDANTSSPTINSNDYFSELATHFVPSAWNAQWTWRAGSGNLKDSSYVTTNPHFIDPSHNNYQMTNPPPGWQTLPTNQGPVNSPFQAAGNTF